MAETEQLKETLSRLKKALEEIKCRSDIDSEDLWRLRQIDDCGYQEIAEDFKSIQDIATKALEEPLEVSEPKKVCCLECKFWSPPKGWEDWTSYKGDEEIPYDWSQYQATCSKLPDIHTVWVDVTIHGDAWHELEVETAGTFGCFLGEKRDS